MRGVPLACWCRQQRCLALSFGLLLLSSSSFVLSLTPPFSVLSFIYFRRTDFVVGLGLIFGTVSLHCLACSFFLLVTLPTAFVSLSLSIFILFPCQSLAGIGIYGIGTVRVCTAWLVFFLFASRSANRFPVSVFYLPLVSL